MCGPFRPLQEHVGRSFLAVGALCFVVLLDCMLQFSLKVVQLPFVERDVSTVN
jgi:hypothetical protein